MGEFVKSLFSDAVSSGETRVIQAITPSGVVVGEFFAFYGQEGGGFRDWKEEICLLHPGARMEQAMAEAIGIQNWIAKYSPYDLWRKPEQLPGIDIINYIDEHRRRWFESANLSTQREMEVCCLLLHIDFVGTRPKFGRAGTVIEAIYSRLVTAGCIGKN